jgi:hypothetical protein
MTNIYNLKKHLKITNLILSTQKFAIILIIALPLWICSSGAANTTSTLSPENTSKTSKHLQSLKKSKYYKSFKKSEYYKSFKKPKYYKSFKKPKPLKNDKTARRYYDFDLPAGLYIDNNDKKKTRFYIMTGKKNNLFWLFGKNGIYQAIKKENILSLTQPEIFKKSNNEKFDFNHVVLGSNNDLQIKFFQDDNSLKTLTRVNSTDLLNHYFKKNYGVKFSSPVNELFPIAYFMALIKIYRGCPGIKKHPVFKRDEFNDLLNKPRFKQRQLIVKFLDSLMDNLKKNKPFYPQKSPTYINQIKKHKRSIKKGRIWPKKEDALLKKIIFLANSKPEYIKIDSPSSFLTQRLNDDQVQCSKRFIYGISINYLAHKKYRNRTDKDFMTNVTNNLFTTKIDNCTNSELNPKNQNRIYNLNLGLFLNGNKIIGIILFGYMSGQIYLREDASIEEYNRVLNSSNNNNSDNSDIIDIIK